jgi:hypothetical protein
LVLLGRCLRIANFRERDTGEVRRIPLLETVWKVLRTSQPLHHEPRHRRVNKGLPCGAQSLVVLGHPPVMRDPQAKVRSTTHLRGSTVKPRAGISFCQSTCSPSLAHSCAQSYELPPRGVAFEACVPPRRSNPIPPLPTFCPSLGSQHLPTRAKGVQGDRALGPTEQPDAVLVRHLGVVDPSL